MTFFSNEKVDRFVVIDKVAIFMTHGDKYGVKSTLRSLYNQVKDVNPNIVLFGHTHHFFNQDIDGIRFINPGSLSSVRGGEGTYILMTIDGENFSIEKCSF